MKTFNKQVILVIIFDKRQIKATCYERHIVFHNNQLTAKYFCYVIYETQLKKCFLIIRNLKFEVLTFCL